MKEESPRLVDAHAGMLVVMRELVMSVLRESLIATGHAE